MCRSAGTQLALLDRIAGTSADARLFGARLQQLRSLREQLQAVEALGSEDARDQLQHLVDTVRHSCRSEQGRTALVMLAIKPASQHLGRSDKGKVVQLPHLRCWALWSWAGLLLHPLCCHHLEVGPHLLLLAATFGWLSHAVRNARSCCSRCLPAHLWEGSALISRSNGNTVLHEQVPYMQGQQEQFQELVHLSYFNAKSDMQPLRAHFLHCAGVC